MFFPCYLRDNVLVRSSPRSSLSLRVVAKECAAGIRDAAAGGDRAAPQVASWGYRGPVAIRES